MQFSFRAQPGTLIRAFAQVKSGLLIGALVSSFAFGSTFTTNIGRLCTWWLKYAGTEISHGSAPAPKFQYIPAPKENFAWMTHEKQIEYIEQLRDAREALEKKSAKKTGVSLAVKSFDAEVGKILKTAPLRDRLSLFSEFLLAHQKSERPRTASEAFDAAMVINRGSFANLAAENTPNPIERFRDADEHVALTYFLACLERPPELASPQSFRSLLGRDFPGFIPPPLIAQIAAADNPGDIAEPVGLLPIDRELLKLFMEQSPTPNQYRIRH